MKCSGKQGRFQLGTCRNESYVCLVQPVRTSVQTVYHNQLEKKLQCNYSEVIIDTIPLKDQRIGTILSPVLKFAQR